jgi:hypothetical protein
MLRCAHTLLALLLPWWVCCRSCLELATKHRLENIAFPAISTGVYGYPVSDAAEVRPMRRAVSGLDMHVVCFLQCSRCHQPVHLRPPRGSMPRSGLSCR